MQLLEASGQYIINDTEYFYNVDTPIYHPDKIKAYIPKLMCSIPKGKPNITKEAIPQNLFINSRECKPNPDKMVSLQNFVTLSRPTNLSPSFYQTSRGGRMIIDQKHILSVTGKDIRQMHFIEDK